MARRQWRCFHCDEVFTRERDAAQHFGSDDGAAPACKIEAYQGPLVDYIRDLEERLMKYMVEDSEIARSIAILTSEHAAALRSEEEKGYERGVRDMKALGYRTEAA